MLICPTLAISQGLLLHRTLRLIAGAAVLGVSQVLAAPSTARTEVESVRPLLIMAAQQGEARGVLVGPAADAIASQFVSRAPIEVDVRAVAELPTPGCRRLQVDTRQANVADRVKAASSSAPALQLPAKNMLLRYQISFCADGSFPPAAGNTAIGPDQSRARSEVGAR